MGGKSTRTPKSTLQFPEKSRVLLQGRQITIPLNLHRGWEGRKSAVVSRHILCDATRSRELVQTTLRSGSTTQIVQSSDDLEHRRESGLAETKTQTPMRPESKVSVCVHVTVEPDFLGLLERSGVLACRYLEKEIRISNLTY